LYIKIPAPKGVITVFGDQQEARNIEKGHTPGQTNIYQLKSTEERKEPYEEAKRDKEKIEIAADGETKKVYSDDMPDRSVTIRAYLNPEGEEKCKTPDFHRKPESLYHRDSPWISGYRVQNVSQIDTQSHTSHHIKLIVHEFITSPLWSTSLQASWLNQSENSTQR
jgi:hypothetical protein